MKKYQWNEVMYQWERTDRVQSYKGVMIETQTTHDDREFPIYHRQYKITWPDGRESIWGINKRGGNIRELKNYIDFKAKYGEL